ncbi:hypothetical protein BCR34DRAFT_284941 [Clohesyomyces aquaticus]|uniref:Uncharacterized protein n=1 Tax=Clohesyomyces aquaticus TaxID=1231657 RepID=A0A1Y1ZRG1_9PLEO|nr:hypothetical protein BCR34DRAFT_284941 [Clohesyomyces aquaticus]
MIQNQDVKHPEVILTHWVGCTNDCPSSEIRLRQTFHTTLSQASTYLEGYLSPSQSYLSWPYSIIMLSQPSFEPSHALGSGPSYNITVSPRILYIPSWSFLI